MMTAVKTAFLTVPDLAELYRVCPDTVLLWHRQGRLAGLSVAVVQALEQGVRAAPRLSTVLKPAAALGLTVGDLAG
jgi:hypothetical protein